MTHAGNAGYAAAGGIHGAQHQASYRLGGATGAEIGGVLFDVLKHPDLTFCDLEIRRQIAIRDICAVCQMNDLSGEDLASRQDFMVQQLHCTQSIRIQYSKMIQLGKSG